MSRSSSLPSSSYESKESSYLSSPLHDDYLSETPKITDIENVEYDEEGTKSYPFHLEKETNCETQIEENIECYEGSCAHDEGVKEPKVGMTFDTIKELSDFYAIYGKKMGFGVYKRSSQKSLNDEETKYVTVACNRAQKSVSKSKNSFNPRPITKTDCGAKVSAVVGADKKWHISKVSLEHNHPFSLSKGRFYRCHRVVNGNVKRVKCSLVLDRVNELKSEILSGKVSTSSPVCTPHTSASIRDNNKIRDPNGVQGKGRPAGRIKPTSDKIIKRNEKEEEIATLIILVVEPRTVKQ